MVQLPFWPLELVRVGQGCLQEGGSSEGHQSHLTRSHLTEAERLQSSEARRALLSCGCLMMTFIIQVFRKGKFTCSVGRSRDGGPLGPEHRTSCPESTVERKCTKDLDLSLLLQLLC